MMGPEAGVLGLIILILDIYAIIKTLGSPAGGAEKALWIVLILFLPLIGLILWFFLGPKG
jgi:hypothetical protein